MKRLAELFLEGLGDMFYAEEQLVKALPKLARVATHDDLREAIESHLSETEGHVQKVKQIFGLFGTTPKARKCAAILGIIKEAEEIVLENKKFPTINAAIIFASQKAEHYEIASYGTLREWARQLNNATAVSIIDEILDEEKAANNRLTSLAEKHCNLTADSGSFDREVVGHAS